MLILVNDAAVVKVSVFRLPQDLPEEHTMYANAHGDKETTTIIARKDKGVLMTLTRQVKTTKSKCIKMNNDIEFIH